MLADGSFHARALDGCIPLNQDEIIPRHGLLDRLDRAARVTQISAPAGYGKTVLVRSWLSGSGRTDSAAWVTAQGGEQDPAEFCRLIRDALRATVAGAKLIRPSDEAPGTGWAVVERLIADLSALEEPLWLVIDDVHHLCSPEMQAQLRLLIMCAPPEVRFLLVGRADAPLGLHRLRLEGELTEVRAAGLRFTLDEARALLRAGGATLPEPSLADLVARTEGWAAGLRLAARSLTGHPDPARFAAEFSGADRTVAEYLRTEVLDRLAEPARQLLLRTSVCERFSGELADLLSGGSGGEEALRDLEEAGVFVTALDARRSVFRCHPLFADLLRRELRRGEPGRLAQLHGVAALWFAAHGDPAEAVGHAQAAGEWNLAVRLLTEHFLGLVLGGRGTLVPELLARFSAEAAAGPEPGVLLAAAEQVLAGQQETGNGVISVAVAELRLAQGDPSGAVAALAPVLAGAAPTAHSGWMTQAYLLEAITRDALGDQAAETLSLLGGPGPAPVPSGPGEPAGLLTDGETRILRYLPTNLPVPEIAARLCLSVHTVRTHTRHLYEKLCVHSRTQAVEQARDLGLLGPSDRGWSRQPAG
jgi:LuxR family transcriptional regulator, maltose regulon positive regulatory protein